MRDNDVAHLRCETFGARGIPGRDSVFPTQTES